MINKNVNPDDENGHTSYTLQDDGVCRVLRAVCEVLHHKDDTRFRKHEEKITQNLRHKFLRIVAEKL